MRDPINYEPLPYTDAAILISPTPAAKRPATWHVDEWRYDDTETHDDLIACARRTTLSGRSVTDCHTAGYDPLHDFVANIARSGKLGLEVAKLLIEMSPIRLSRAPRHTGRTHAPNTNQFQVYYPTSAADAEAFYAGIRAGVEERRRTETT